MEEPERFLREELGKRFTLKEKAIGSPEQYLGNKVSQVTLENGFKCQSFSSSQHVQADVKNVEDYHSRSNIDPLLKAKLPWPSDCCPEADVTPDLTLLKASYHQSLIRFPRRVTELRRVELAMQVPTMASVMCLPREGHLNAGFQIFSFLKINQNVVAVFDPTEPEIDQTQFPTEDQHATPYCLCKEYLLSNAPVPRDIGYTMGAFVDSDHAGDSVTRRS